MSLRERAGRERGAAKSPRERGITDEIGGGEGGQDLGVYFLPWVRRVCHPLFLPISFLSLFSFPLLS